MKFLKTYEGFLNEGTFPMKEWVNSHIVGYMKSKFVHKFTKLLVKKIGLDYVKDIRSTRFKFDKNIISHEIFNERGIEDLPYLQYLGVNVRHIYMSGHVWIQISGPTNMLYNPSSFSSMFDFDTWKNNTLVVVKNFEDIEKLKEEVLKRHGHESKKGFNKEVDVIAKEMNFNLIWDEEAVQKMADQIVLAIPKALEKMLDYNKNYLDKL